RLARVVPSKHEARPCRYPRCIRFRRALARSRPPIRLPLAPGAVLSRRGGTDVRKGFAERRDLARARGAGGILRVAAREAARRRRRRLAPARVGRGGGGLPRLR